MTKAQNDPTVERGPDEETGGKEELAKNAKERGVKQPGEAVDEYAGGERGYLVDPDAARPE